MRNVPKQTFTLTLKPPVQMALIFAALFPLLTHATDAQADYPVATSVINTRHDAGTIDQLPDLRDPRIAGLSISDLLPAETDTRNNTVRYPAVPVTAAPSSSWPAPPAGPSPLLTYIGAVAATIATGSPYLPTYPAVPAPVPGTFDNRK